MNLSIINPNSADKQNIIALYKENRDYLSIPFNRVFDSMIDNPYFWIVKDNNNLIGMCGIKYKPIIKEYEVQHLCIKSTYRRLGIAHDLIAYAISNRGFINKMHHYPIVAYANIGADNNTFYESISTDKSIIHRKHTDLIRYILMEDINATKYFK